MRKLSGYTIFALSWISYVCVPVVPFLAIATSEKIALAGGFYLFSQITWYAGLAILGPEVLEWIRRGRAWLSARWRGSDG